MSGDSYYGDPIINPPIWEERDIAGYLFTGGLAGASSLLAAGADMTGRPVLARRCKLAAVAAAGVSLTALVHDLGRPARFLNMLRVFKPTSPMSVGAWILAGYAPLAGAAALSDLTGRPRRPGTAAGLGAATLGAGVASYTAALIADTAVPAWHEGRRELPFVFVGSAASAGAGFGLIAAPLSENAPARRLAVLGAGLELAAEQVMRRRMGMVSEALESGTRTAAPAAGKDPHRRRRSQRAHRRAPQSHRRRCQRSRAARRVGPHPVWNLRSRHGVGPRPPLHRRATTRPRRRDEGRDSWPVVRRDMATRFGARATALASWSSRPSRPRTPASTSW